MKAVIRNIVAHTYQPLLVKYLSRTRVFRYNDIRIEVPPQVFHPGFFFSTRLLLQFIRNLSLVGKKFLEPGCGSGLISLFVAKQGAIVTATDINPFAITALQKNSLANKTHIDIIQSDLFNSVPEVAFDIIAVNPPYYKKQPVEAKDFAWYCGQNGEYFESFFMHLSRYIHKESGIYMVLFEGCDIEMIANKAASYGFDLVLLETHKNLLEKNFIYQIRKMK